MTQTRNDRYELYAHTLAGAAHAAAQAIRRILDAADLAQRQAAAERRAARRRGETPPPDPLTRVLLTPAGLDALRSLLDSTRAALDEFRSAIALDAAHPEPL